jgi:hypothetical protein
VSNKIRPSVCSDCQMAKSHSLLFPLSASQPHGPLDLIFKDVWGPSPSSSTSGSRYYLMLMIIESLYGSFILN